MLSHAFKHLYFKLGGEILAKCGHPAKRSDRVSAFGHSQETIIFPESGQAPDFCHRCLEKMAIRCAWCGGTIFIGDPITLYSPSQSDYRPQENSAKHSDNPLQYVGCLGMDCAQSGSDRSGFWVPPGRVHRVMSPLEIAMTTGRAIIVGDLGNMRRGISLLE